MIERSEVTMTEKKHPGITMHKLSFGGGFIGLLFTVGCSLIFLLGFPTLWYFVAFAFGLGIGVALLLRLVHSRRDNHSKPLSIINAEANVIPARKPKKEKLRFRPLPRIASA